MPGKAGLGLGLGLRLTLPLALPLPLAPPLPLPLPLPSPPPLPLPLTLPLTLTLTLTRSSWGAPSAWRPCASRTGPGTPRSQTIRSPREHDGASSRVGYYIRVE